MRSRSRTLLALAVVALVATAGCLSGPLGAGTDASEPTETTAQTDSTASTTTDGTAHTSDDGDGTTERNDLEIRTADPADAPDLAASLNEPVACDRGWVSYWGTGNAEMLWEADGELRVGWTVPGNQSMLFVAFENDTAVGVDHVQYEHGVTADGSPVPVNATTGEHRYAVVAIVDVNENGEYDPDVDRPCGGGDDHELSWTGWIWVDWDGDN